MSQFENSNHLQNSQVDRNKVDSNRQLLSQNGQSQKNIEQSEFVPRRSSQPNNYGNQTTNPQANLYPSFNYPLMGQQTMKDQEQQEQIQKLMKENETMRYQWRALEQENQKLKNDIAQQTMRNKNNQNEIQELQDQIMLNKNENKRLTQTIQEDQYQLLDLQKLRKQVEINKGLENQCSELEQQLAVTNKQLLDQKRQNALQESDNQNQKEILEKYKSQVKDQTLNLEAQLQKNETLLNDNRKMKQALDMIHKDLKSEQDQNQALVQKLNQLQNSSKDQVNNLQKNLTTLNFQNEQLKNQVTQLQQKEKELQNSQNINIQLDAKIRAMQQQIAEQQRQIEQYTMTISTGKNEYTKLATKCQQQEQDIWKMKESIGSLSTQNQLLQNKCFQLEKTLEDGLQKSQIQSNEFKSQLDQWRTYGMQLEQELKKREMALVQLENELVKFEGQLKMSLENEAQLRGERTGTIAKMKEMHTDLLLYEKKSEQNERDIMALQEKISILQQTLERAESDKQQLNSEVKSLMDELHRIQSQHDIKSRDFETLQMRHESDSSVRDRELQNLRQQNQTLVENNNQLNMDLKKERENQIQLDSKIRLLENEIHNLQFQQQLKQQYQWNPEPVLSLSNQIIQQTETSQIHNSMVQAQSNKPIEVSSSLPPPNESTLHRKTPSTNLIKSKNYDLRFQNQPQNQQH